MKVQGIFLIALVGSSACASAPRVPAYFEVHGHRGARARRPENSLPAFRYAVEVGVSTLEMDLGITRDHQIVINHDMVIDTERCTTEDPGLAARAWPLIHSLSLRQVQSYNCNGKNSDFRQQVFLPNERVPIPSLRELLQLLNAHPHPAAHRIRLNLETKIDDENPSFTVGPEKFVELIMQELRAANFPLERVILQSFDYRTITYAKQKWKNLKTAALLSRAPASKSALEKFLSDLFAQTGADYLSPNGRICSKDLVEISQAHGKKVVVYTINKKRQWRHFVRLGVDGIITDDPQLLLHDLF